jgi:anthranilate synthase/aminodeoxychorismate synthase-like glutamine amidotransferase
MTRVLIIDNYDSFVYNIAQYLGFFGAEIVTRRNDIKLNEAMKVKPDLIVLSPGPGHPRDSKVTLEILSTMSKNIPTLGVCLGHQAIGEVFGGTVTRANRIIHGKTCLIYHNGKDLFKEIPNPITATRYHSLIINNEGLPDCLEVAAVTDIKEIMAVKHKEYPIYGVQFHPESILTQSGKDILFNFLKVAL